MLVELRVTIYIVKNHPDFGWECRICTKRFLKSKKCEGWCKRLHGGCEFTGNHGFPGELSKLLGLLCFQTLCLGRLFL